MTKRLINSDNVSFNVGTLVVLTQGIVIIRYAGNLKKHVFVQCNFAVVSPPVQ